MKKHSWTVYIVSVHVLLAIVLLKSDFLERAERKFGLLDVAPPTEVSEFYNRMVQVHSRIDPSVPNDAVIFIGDSITQGLCVCDIADKSVNYGIGSDTTEGVLKRISSYASISRASAVVLAIGVNDLQYRSDDDILRNFELIICQITVQTRLVLCLILPVDERINDSMRGFNRRVVGINERLKTLCNNSQNTLVVDSFSAFVDRQQNLSSEYHIGDGVHLNLSGYAIWIAELKKAVEQVQLHASDKAIDVQR